MQMFEKHWPVYYSTGKEGGHEFEQALGDSEGQGSLAYCSHWGAQSWAWLSDRTTTTGGCGPRRQTKKINGSIRTDDS